MCGWGLSHFFQENVDVIGGEHAVRAARRHSTFIASPAIGIDVRQFPGGDIHRRQLTFFVLLHEDAGNWGLRVRGTLGGEGSMLTIKLDGRRLHDVRSLPEPRASGIESCACVLVCGHFLCGHVYGIVGGELRAGWVRLEIAVSRLHVAFRNRFSGLAIDVDRVRGETETSLCDPGRASQMEHIVGGRVGSEVCVGEPRSLLGQGLVISEVTLLFDFRQLTLRVVEDLEFVAGRGLLCLAGRARHDLGLRLAEDVIDVALRIEVRKKPRGGDRG